MSVRKLLEAILRELRDLNRTRGGYEIGVHVPPIRLPRVSAIGRLDPDDEEETTP